MSKLELYRDVIKTTLKLDDEELKKLETKTTGCWDSFSQLNLVSALEEAFSLQFSMDDMADLVSYQAGLEILRRRGIEL